MVLDPATAAQEVARAAVIAEALTWLRTPYHHHGRVKGAGVDCAQLLCAVYEACGCTPHLDPGNYAHDWHLHRGEEVFIGWLQRAGARLVSEPKPGDVALFRYGRAYSHGAIVVEPTPVLVHAYVGLGVVRTRLDEAPLQGRQVQFWSLW